MKISFITPSFFPATKYGGPIFSTLNLCRELFRKKITLDIQTTNVHRNERLDVTTGVQVSLAELDGGYVTYHKENVTDRFSLGFIRAIPKSIFNSDLCHSQSIFSLCTPLCILFSWLYKKKLVISPRGSLGYFCLSSGTVYKKTWLTVFFKPFLKNIYWHVTSLEEKNDVLKVFSSVEDGRFLVIPNGINRTSVAIPSFEEMMSVINVSGVSKYVLVSGRVDYKKGIDFTISAMTSIHPDIHLFIMGDDYGIKNQLLQLAKSLGVLTRVHFLGHINGNLKWALYKHALVMSLNSRHENFGNVYLESLSVGTPIIASTNTPWSFVNNCGAGFCIENIPELIAEKINYFTTIEKPIDECFDVAQNYYWDNIADRFIIEYQRILNVN